MEIMAKTVSAGLKLGEVTGVLERSFIPLVFVLLATVPLFGCGGNSSTGPADNSSDIGSFELSYSGDASGTVSGVALFDDSAPLPDGTTKETFVAVGRVPDAPPESDTGFNLGRESPPPQSGTYDLTAFDFDGTQTQAFGLAVIDDSNDMSVQATGGTVTFTDVSPGRVQGSFTATLSGDMAGNQNVTVAATGTFDAPRCDFLGTVGNVECD